MIIIDWFLQEMASLESGRASSQITYYYYMRREIFNITQTEIQTQIKTLIYQIHYTD